MKRERINKLLQNNARISVAERNLGAAEAKVKHWKNRLQKLRQEELRLGLESQLPLGRSTRKNQKKYVVWASIRDHLNETAHRAGLTTAELYQALRDEHRNLNIITFRAYLREFSGTRGLLLKHDERWQLTETVRQAQVDLKTV